MDQAQQSADASDRSNLTLRQLTDLLGNLGDLESDPNLQVIGLDAGEVLFEQGDAGDSMYVVIAGMLGVRVRHADGSETEIDRLVSGALVGEMALLSGQARSATVYALVDSGLIRLTASTLEQLAEADLEMSETLEATVAPRWQRVLLAGALKELFGDLDAASLHALQEQMDWQHYSNGDVIFRQGDPSDGMYIVVNGRLHITAVTAEGAVRHIGEIGAGQTVGEFSLLTEETRAATVHAVRETNVVRITPPVFQRLSQKYPKLIGEITRIIIERRQQALGHTKSKAPRSLTMALLPADASVDVWHFAQELAEALGVHGPVLPMNRERFDAKLGRPGAAQSSVDDTIAPAIVAWMDELESEYRYLLYIADATQSAWTRRCIGQADRVLIIADPRCDPQPGPAEQLLGELETPVRKEIVLWQPAATEQPAGTAAWLDARQVSAHHHVRYGDSAHMARLARRLTGHGVGLVFSGGAARGWAHLGVIRALEELDIPVDYAGGTSMGSVLAGAYCYLQSVDEMMQYVVRFDERKVLFDRTLPFTSMMTSKKVTGLLRDYYDEQLIEDLWVPFFCLATNLTTAEPVVFQRGPLWRAIRSSLAIPGVFTPVMEDGDVIVDGGVLDNFPVPLMIELCESEHIIGVNVAPFQEKKRLYDFDTYISGWRILLSRVNPFSKPLRSPGLVGTIMRSLEINSVRRSKREEASLGLMIHPDVKQFDLYDFSRYEDISQIGYDAAYEPLQEWKRQTL